MPYIIAGLVLSLIVIGSLLSKKIMINTGAILAPPGLALIWDQLPGYNAQFYTLWAVMLLVGLVTLWNMYQAARGPAVNECRKHYPGWNPHR